MGVPYPCLLLVSDLHVSKDNIPDFELNWQEALAVCKEHGIGDLVVGGDLFYSRASQTLDVLLAVYDALERAYREGINVVLANGNHDKVNQSAVRGYCHVYNFLFTTQVVNEYMRFDRPEWGFALHVIPYFPEDGNFKEVLDRVTENGLLPDKKNYLYIHQGIRGGLARAVGDELPASFFKDFDYVFVGHYHDRRRVPGTRIEYIGSSRQQNFGEDEEKGYTILFSDGSHRFVRNEVNVRYRVLDVAVEDLERGVACQVEELTGAGHYKVKVRVHGSAGKVKGLDKESLLKLGASKVEVVIREPEVTESRAVDMLEKLDVRGLRENYEWFCREKEIEDVSLGISYLSRIGSSCGN